MNILKSYNEKELTLSVEGRINTVTSKELDKEINDELGNFDSLILDFTNLEYISSAGLRVLVATQRKLKPDNIPFIIKNSNDAIREIFRMSGVDRILGLE
jgi:anti-anti-sigma factor